MRKRVITPVSQNASVSSQAGLDVESAAVVEVTSEDTAYPIESCARSGILVLLKPCARSRTMLLNSPPFEYSNWSSYLTRVAVRLARRSTVCVWLDIADRVGPRTPFANSLSSNCKNHTSAHKTACGVSPNRVRARTARGGKTGWRRTIDLRLPSPDPRLRQASNHRALCGNRYDTLAQQ
jgi:hypothetical protein